MPFPQAEKQKLLTVKGIGPTVIRRLEAQGFSSLQELATASAEEIVRNIAQEVGSTCWRNSPQARQAIEAAIRTAAEIGQPPPSFEL